MNIQCAIILEGQKELTYVFAKVKGEDTLAKELKFNQIIVLGAYKENGETYYYYDPNRGANIYRKLGREKPWRLHGSTIRARFLKIVEEESEPKIPDGYEP